MPNYKTLVQTLCAAFCAILCAALPLEGLPFAALAEKGGGVMRLAMRNIFSDDGGGDFPYILDGASAIYDGWWNAGMGIHDANAQTWADLSGNNHVLQRSSGSSVAWEDKAIVMTSKQSPVMSTKDFILQGANEFTLELALDTRTSSIYAEIICLRSAANQNNRVGINRQPPDQQSCITPVFRTAETSTIYYNNPLYTYLTTFGVGLTLSSNGSVIFYHNGKPSYYSSVPPGSVDKYIAPIKGFILGRNGTDGNPQQTTTDLTGKIYAVRWHRRALSSAEIAANYAVDKARFNLPTA